jgi:phage shock protein A
MGETADQIVTEIDQTREDLKTNLEELETRVKSVTDWRAQFERHPGALLAAAMVGGVLLSAMVKKGFRI